MERRPTRILVVDDEPKICQFLEALLQRDGHEVVACQNGANALARLQNGAFGLVLTDLKMPGMDGFELVRRVKQMAEEIPVIVITGYATIETAIQALRYGVDDYIMKPFNIDELRRVVSRTILNSHLAFENRGLLDRLGKLEAELQYHRNLLQNRSRLADNQLREENVQLRRRVRELSVLEEIEMSANSILDADELLRAYAVAAVRRLGAQKSSVLLREHGALVVRACDEERRSRMLGNRQCAGEGIDGAVARDERAILVTDIHGHGDFGPLARGGYETSSFISVPVTHRGALYGVFNVADRRDGQPFNSSDLEIVSGMASRLGAGLERSERVNRIRDDALAAVAEATEEIEDRDQYMRGHSRRVAAYARSLAAAMGLDEHEQEMVFRAGQVHDVGQYRIPDAILHKSERLSEPELARMQDHAMVGARVIEPFAASREISAAVRHHHERFDGAGYPDRLKAAEIPILARIISIVDAFDAMTSQRPYRRRLEREEACEELRRQSGAQFDGEIAPLFCEAVAVKDASLAGQAAGDERHTESEI